MALSFLLSRGTWPSFRPSIQPARLLGGALAGGLAGGILGVLFHVAGGLRGPAAFASLGEGAAAWLLLLAVGGMAGALFGALVRPRFAVTSLAVGAALGVALGIGLALVVQGPWALRAVAGSVAFGGVWGLAYALLALRAPRRLAV